MKDWGRLAVAVDSEVEHGMPDLFDAIRIPSVGAWGMDNLRRSGDFLRALLERDGWEVDSVEVPGNVVLLAETGPTDGPATVLLYGHHDVQPPEPLDAWTSPPFEPVVRDGRIFGRGSSDDKGEFFCHIFAVRALRRLRAIRVRIKLFLDGGEENASPNLDQAIGQLRPKLKASFMYTADGAAHISGRPRITYGFRGNLRMRLSVRTAARNLHSGAWGNLAPNAALRLAQVLARFKGEDGRVTVPGFYSGIRPPDGAERRVMAEIPFDEAESAAAIGARELEGPHDVPALERLMFMPTFTVIGLSSGYCGPGFQAAIPAEAEALLEVRFVPDQNPHRIYEMLKAQLYRTAPEAELELLGSMPASRTPLNTPATARVVGAMRRGYGVDPILYPCSGGSAPEALFTRDLGIPSLWGHCANHDQQNHAPDENMSLEYMHRCARTTAALLLDLSTTPL